MEIVRSQGVGFFGEWDGNSGLGLGYWMMKG